MLAECYFNPITKYQAVERLFNNISIHTTVMKQYLFETTICGKNIALNQKD
jgi:hypothetical protein